MSEILEVFLKNKRAIKVHLKRFFSNADDIEDVVQETFLRGFAAETRHKIAEPKAYLFQIAKNIALDRLRKNALVPMDQLEDSKVSSIILDETQATAEDMLDGRRKLSIFAQAVAHLPPQCRRAFVMRHIDGFTYKQIANRMDISVSAVEKHLTVGLVKCDAYLRERGYDPSEFGGASGSKSDSAASAAVDGMKRDD